MACPSVPASSSSIPFLAQAASRHHTISLGMLQHGASRGSLSKLSLSKHITSRTRCRLHQPWLYPSQNDDNGAEPLPYTAHLEILEGKFSQLAYKIYFWLFLTFSLPSSFILLFAICCSSSLHQSPKKNTKPSLLPRPVHYQA